MYGNMIAALLNPAADCRCEFPGCTKTFTTSSALGSHQRVHVRDATNYPCPFEGCPKVYDKACRLKLHMRSHTGERPFKCTFEVNQTGGVESTPPRRFAQKKKIRAFATFFFRVLRNF